MESFDFNALSPEDQQQTFAFLGLPDNSLMSGFAPDVPEAFPDPMMELPFFDDEAWAAFGDGFGGPAMPFTLADDQPLVQWNGQIGLQQPPPQVGSYQPDESRRTFVCSRPRLELPSQPKMPSLFNCDWPSCTSRAQYEIQQLESHKTLVHTADVLATWPGSCSWPGCNCKAFFKTGKRLESHVYNIHVTPLYCSVDKCTHRKPFERQADLDRHVASRHTKERKYKCLHPRCEYSFSRKDKFKLHQNCHQRFPCHYNHCGKGCTSQTGLSLHSKEHLSWPKPYECALGSCANTLPSRFIYSHLREHLEIDHNCSKNAADIAFNFIYDVKITMANFPTGIPDFKDCEDCKKKLEAAKAGEDMNN